MYQYARTLPLPPSPQALCHYPVCTGMQCGCFYFLGALFSSLSSNCIGEITPLCPVSNFACPTHLHWSFLGNLLYHAEHLGTLQTSCSVGFPRSPEPCGESQVLLPRLNYCGWPEDEPVQGAPDGVADSWTSVTTGFCEQRKEKCGKYGGR